jgi:hypothetical protein
MALAVVGILLMLLLTAAALRYFITRPPDRYDRSGAFNRPGWVARPGGQDGRRSYCGSDS